MRSYWRRSFDGRKDLWLICGILWLIGMSLLLHDRTAIGQGAWQAVLMLALLTVITESQPVQLPRSSSTISVTGAVICASFVLVGPFWAAVLAALGTIRWIDLQGQTSLRALLFNRVQIFLAASAGAHVYILSGGLFGIFNVARDGLPLLLGGLAFSVINLVISSVYLSVGLKKTLRSVWRTDLSMALANYLTYALMGALLASTYGSMGVLGPLLFLVPLMFSRWALQKQSELRQVYIEVMATLINALEVKDSYTAGHSVRVAELATQLATFMRIRESTVDAIYFLGLLHDIGKIGISDTVLKKTGVYVMHEYLQMQQHPEIGVHIVKDLHFVAPHLGWIATHHERWDGNGFPFQLSEMDIPLGGRILAVVDTFDAITSDRPYRKGAPPEVAWTEIARGSGKQFDPVVAERFLTMQNANLDADLWQHARGQAERARREEQTPGMVRRMTPRPRVFGK